MPGRGFRRKLKVVHRILPIMVLLLGGTALLTAQAALPPAPSPAQSQEIVDTALANELSAAQDTSHPMRYELRKTTPRLTSTHEIYETRDGDVARLLSINGQQLSAADEQKEQARLEELADDPGKQRHRKQAEAADTARALQVLQALPMAFLYQYAGTAQGAAGMLEKFTYRPNPAFSPPDLETQVLTAMTGAIWIDPAQERVTRLEGRLEQDVDFGWGILGRLNKGGSIAIDQAEVAPGVWRIVRLQMAMSGRVVFRTRNFDMTEEENHFAQLPAGMGYREAIVMLNRESARTE